VNFNVEIYSVERHQGGDGIDKATVVVNGLGAFRFLKYECGVHRVQRVPKASTGNKSDRLQTSTCSVAVLPLPDDADYHVPECELKVEFVKSSGPGGQNVNKLETACRVTHLPSGLSVKCQEHRTQLKNKEIAIQQVTSKLYQQNYEEQMKHTIAFRKSQIGNMNRNEKIRSYHFTRNQVTDHRIEKGTRQVPDIAALFSGKLGYDIIRELREKIAWEHQTKSLDEYLASY
jgi:peptide chain release factor 1